MGALREFTSWLATQGMSNSTADASSADASAAWSDAPDTPDAVATALEDAPVPTEDAWSSDAAQEPPLEDATASADDLLPPTATVEESAQADAQEVIAEDATPP